MRWVEGLGSTDLTIGVLICLIFLLQVKDGRLAVPLHEQVGHNFIVDRMEALELIVAIHLIKILHVVL